MFIVEIRFKTHNWSWMDSRLKTLYSLCLWKSIFVQVRLFSMSVFHWLRLHQLEYEKFAPIFFPDSLLCLHPVSFAQLIGTVKVSLDGDFWSKPSVLRWHSPASIQAPTWMLNSRDLVKKKFARHSCAFWVVNRSGASRAVALLQTSLLRRRPACSTTTSAFSNSN